MSKSRIKISSDSGTLLPTAALVALSCTSCGADPAPKRGLDRTITVLEMVPATGTAGPVNFLAIVPLNQGADVTLELCKAIVSILPKSPPSANSPATYRCRSGTVAEIAASSDKVSLQKYEKGVVSVLHVIEATSGRVNNVDAFEYLNVSGLLPDGATMKICQDYAAGAGNRDISDNAGQVVYRDVHYTCEVDENP